MAKQAKLKENQLHRWKLIEDFQRRLASASAGLSARSTWSDPRRTQDQSEYLSLFLFGLLNPVVQTMRGLCAASHLPKVQKSVCSCPVSLGSFSANQAVLDPALLARVFNQLAEEVGSSQSPSIPTKPRWLIQDSSLFEALPRMFWALWRRQGKVQSQVRVHLSLDLEQDSPAQVVITPGKKCERAVLRGQIRAGDAYVADRYYGEDYKLFDELDRAGAAFVIRLKTAAILNVEEELPLSPADREAGVISDTWGRLGDQTRSRSRRVRVVEVLIEDEVLRLVTNLGPEELSAAAVALLYKRRWQVELFFRWIKCILGCRHWLAESAEGVAIQIYLALIAALLLQLYTGQRPNKRMMELIRFYLLGVASLEDLWRGLDRERQRLARRKKA